MTNLITAQLQSFRFTPSLWIRTLHAYIYKMRDQVPNPHHNTGTATVFTPHIMLKGPTQPVIGRIFLQISHPKIPSGINTQGDFRGHSRRKRRFWRGGKYGTLILVYFNVYVCLFGTQRYLATAHDFTVARIESRLDKAFEVFVFFHVKDVKFNPLTYTDVPETAGLARSINP